MRTFAILNMKGGVGKTTTAINLAYLLATEYRRRVLLIDADPQANATHALLPDGERAGLATLLRGNTAISDWVIAPSGVPSLDVVPASEELWSIDLESGAGGAGVINVLRDFRDGLDEDDAYDVIVIDCPPNFSAACVAAIGAANSIIIPVLPDAFSAAGMGGLVRQIDGVRRIHPDVRVAGCLINQWHRADVVEDATAYLRENSPVPVFDTVIRRTDKVEELRSRPVEVAVEADAAAIEAARKEAKERMQAQLDKAKEAQEKARADLMEANSALQRAKLEREQTEIELRKQLEQAEKRAALTSNEDLVLFRTLFDQVQEQVNKMGGVLMKTRGRDPEKARGLERALLALSDKIRETAGQS